MSLRGAAEAIWWFSKKRIATPPAGARNDRLARASPAPTRRPRRSVPMQSLFFVGAGLCAERARSTHARTCPYALTAAVCADPIPVFCRGESSGNGVTGEPTHLMPDAHLHCTKRSAVQVSPLPHGTQCGASVTPPCHCEAQPKQSGGNKNGIATPPAGARNDRRAGMSPAPACGAHCGRVCRGKNRRDPAGYFANIKNNAIAAGMMKNPITMKGPKQPPCSSTGL